MSHVNNALADAFPEQRTRLNALKRSDASVARLADAYNKVNRAIHRGETNVEPMDDFHMEDLRKERLAILDAVAARLRSA